MQNIGATELIKPQVIPELSKGVKPRSESPQRNPRLDKIKRRLADSSQYPSSRELLKEIAAEESIPSSAEKALSQMNNTILQLAKVVEKGGEKAVEAKKILKELLEAREEAYYSVASTINPNIRRVSGNQRMYQVGETHIFGSIIAALDATPALASHQILAERIKTKLIDNPSQTIVIGQDLAPKSLVESTVVFSGSSAQDRIQPYGADIDMAEHIRIRANNQEEAATLLAAAIQTSVDQKIEIEDNNGNKITLHFFEVKAGGNYPQDAREELKGEKLRWSVEEIKRGYKEYQTENGSLSRIDLAQACRDPKMLKVDYLGITEDTVVEVTKVSTVQARDKQENIIIDNSTGQASAFQEIYFNDPSHFGLVEETTNPDKFIGYLQAMNGEITKYSQPDHLNRMKVAKRMYNLLKTQGDLSLIQELSVLFSSDAAKTYQLIERMEMTRIASSKGINVEAQRGKISTLFRQILEQNPSERSKAILDLMNNNNDRYEFGELKKLTLDFCNGEVDKFFERHSNIKNKLNDILTS